MEPEIESIVHERHMGRSEVLLLFLRGSQVIEFYRPVESKNKEI